LPFNCATDAGKNPDPFTFNTSGAAPACALTGEIEEMEGSGKLTLKLTELDCRAPGLVTKIEVELGLLNKDEGATAVIVVPFTRVALNCIGPPSAGCQVTVAFARKFVPVKVSVKLGDPAVALVGEIEVIVGV
jgi:hypothetical protein